MNDLGGHGAFQHPNFVAIPDSKMQGVRSYRESDTPHPLQLQFLTEEGEKAYVGALRKLLSQGKADEAAARLSADLADFQGATAQMCKALTPDQVTIEGWENLLPILAEFEGPAIIAITVGLTNERDLVFDGGQQHPPVLVIGLYSDDAYPFSTVPADAILDECTTDMPSWCGHEEDVEFYADIAGLAELNTALIQNKHRYFLRDGRDGVEGRAPGGYVEYVLGTWIRATRFLQALERAARDHGLPQGARLLAGTAGLHTDFACLLDKAREVEVERAATSKPVASLTMKPWVPKPDPLAEDQATGASLRQKIVQGETAAPVEQPVRHEEQPTPQSIATPIPASNVVKAPVEPSPVAVTPPTEMSHERSASPVPSPTPSVAPAPIAAEACPAPETPPQRDAAPNHAPAVSEHAAAVEQAPAVQNAPAKPRRRGFFARFFGR